jgi:hypothetical protein
VLRQRDLFFARSARRTSFGAAHGLDERGAAEADGGSVLIADHHGFGFLEVAEDVDVGESGELRFEACGGVEDEDGVLLLQVAFREDGGRGLFRMVFIPVRRG